MTDGATIRSEPIEAPTPVRMRDMVRFRALLSGLSVLHERGIVCGIEDFSAAVMRFEMYRQDHDRRRIP